MAAAFAVVVIAISRIVAAQEVACYSCISLNYRQHALSPTEELEPPPSRSNLSQLFAAIVASGVKPAPLSSSCADVALTSQPSFLNTPIVICSSRRRPWRDQCAKLNFQFKGEKIVIRNCLSRMFHDERNIFRDGCPLKPSQPKKHRSLGLLRNITLCTCESDLCNSAATFPAILFIFSLSHFTFHKLVLNIIY